MKSSKKQKMLSILKCMAWFHEDFVLNLLPDTKGKKMYKDMQIKKFGLASFLFWCKIQNAK